MSNLSQQKIKAYWLLAFIVFVGVLICLGLWSYYSKGNVLPLGMLALISGFIYTSNKVNENAWITLSVVFISLLFSLLALIPSSESTNYIFDQRVMKVPLYFIFIYGFFTVVFNYEKLMPKIHEGISFMQSLAIIYFIFEMKYYKDSAFIFIPIVIAVLFSCYSIYHAFVSKKHTKLSRFILSIWSMIVYVFFAIIYLLDFIYLRIDSSEILSVNSLLIIIQYFLLGISMMYIFHHFVMIFSFFPSRETGKEYLNGIKNQRKLHIKRYDPIQQTHSISIITLVYALLLFSLNHFTKLVRPTLIIWFLFFTFPFVLKLINQVKRIFV